jgi:two-component system, sensor histidine kinase and response regulator
MGGETTRALVVCASAPRADSAVKALSRAGRRATACASPEQALAQLSADRAGPRAAALIVDAALLPLPAGALPAGVAVLALHLDPPCEDPLPSLAKGAHEYVCWRAGRRFPIDRLDAALVRAGRDDASPERLLAVVSHELRAPIAGVIGLCDLLLATRLDDEQGDHVRTARLSAEALLGLTDQIVDLARARADGGALEVAPFRIRDLVEDACTLLAPQAHAKGLELNCHVSPDAPSEVLADAGRIRQILVNLIVNAIKYTRRGRVDVHATVEYPGADDSPRLVLDVCDTGAGIRPEDRERVFRPFSQLGESGAPRQGVGLGLAISAESARLLGADLIVESALGSGSRFRLEVPVGVGPDAFPERIDRPLDGCRVLVVDADTTARLVARVYLTAHGARVDDVADAPSALTLLSDPGLARSYDLMIFDMLVPGLDGLELATILRMRADTAELPLLTLTSLVDGSQRAALDALRVARLAKPVRELGLVRAVCRLLRRPPPARRGSVRAASAAAASSAGAGLRVLVADDDALTQRLLRLRLTKLGCRVDAMACGRSALAAGLQRRYDLVLLDGHLPGLSGAEVARELRRRTSPNQTTRIATMSASGAAPCSYADAAFAKPLAVEDLARLLAAAGSDPGRRERELAESLGIELTADESAALVARFLADARSRCAEARLHLIRGELARVADVGHLLRGACATSGAKDLAHLAAGIESAARRSAAPEAEALLARLEAALPHADMSALGSRSDSG